MVSTPQFILVGLLQPSFSKIPKRWQKSFDLEGHEIKRETGVSFGPFLGVSKKGSYVIRIGSVFPSWDTPSSPFPQGARGVYLRCGKDLCPPHRPHVFSHLMHGNCHLCFQVCLRLFHWVWPMSLVLCGTAMTDYSRCSLCDCSWVDEHVCYRGPRLLSCQIYSSLFLSSTVGLGKADCSCLSFSGSQVTISLLMWTTENGTGKL